MGLVVGVEKNSLGEVVAVNVRKANKEVVRRHVGDIILLNPTSLINSANLPDFSSTDDTGNFNGNSKRIARSAAKKCKKLNSDLINEGLV